MLCCCKADASLSGYRETLPEECLEEPSDPEGGAQMTDQQAKVLHYYQATGSDYKRFWLGPKDLAMHFGYYDASIRSHAASLLKMNEVLAETVHLSPRDRVLD